MSRASRVSNPPAAAAAVKNVSSNGGHSNPSCSASVYQSFRPVTRSMTRMPDAIVAPPDLKEEGYASTNTRKSILDASFCIQSAALQPTVTRARTPHKVTTSAWKPLTQPVALSEGQKCASLTKMNPNVKCSRVPSTRVAKDSTNHSASKAKSIVLSGKKNRAEETTSQGDQSDVAVMSSPTKKLQTCKFPSDTCSKRVPSIRILGGKVPAPLPTGKSQTETGKHPAGVPAKLVSASVNVISLSADAAVSLPAQQPDTAKNSNVIAESVNKKTSQVQPLSAKIVNLPWQKFQSDYQKMPSNVLMTTNQVSGSAGATAPMALPKLQIGSVKDTSNVLSNPAYTRALLIKQQQKLLQQYKMGSSQQQQQQQELYIKGPALPWSDETPPVVPLGTRCELCKLDVAFPQQGDAYAPPAVAVLACHHAFHSSCIEGVYGLVEPSQCIACAEAGEAN